MTQGDREWWISSLRESVKSFNETNKPEREKQVVAQFLQNLGIQHSVAELRRREDPPDVIFRDASFEVMDVHDCGRRMHREYKEALKLAETPDDPTRIVAQDVDLKDIRPTECGDRVRLAVQKKKATLYSAPTKAKLDLLAYINLTEYLLITDAMPDPSLFAEMGWRSVSAVYCNASMVFYAATDAPQFLRQKAGTLTGQTF
jgi:hypothetical protein